MRYSTRLKLFRLGLALIYGLIYGLSYATFRNMWEFITNEEIKAIMHEVKESEHNQMIESMEVFLNETTRI